MGFRGIGFAQVTLGDAVITEEQVIVGLRKIRGRDGVQGFDVVCVLIERLDGRDLKMRGELGTLGVVEREGRGHLDLDLARGLGALGVDGSRPIVVYDEAGSFAAARAWWVLRWAGLDVRVLDGGVDAWAAHNRPMTTGDVIVDKAELHVTPGQLPTIEADDAAGFSGTLMDARAPERYRGETEPIDLVAGHIPGAVNVPVAQFFAADGRLPDDARLECKICWHVYDPAAGDPVWQIPPGTPFSALPEHWRCPNCDGARDQFMVLDA